MRDCLIGNTPDEPVILALGYSYRFTGLCIHLFRYYCRAGVRTSTEAGSLSGYRQINPIGSCCPGWRQHRSYLHMRFSRLIE